MSLFSLPRRFRLSVLAVVTLIACAGAGLATQIYSTNNFNTVVAGEVYRSAQPTAKELAEYQQRFGIRTVVNLRGAAPDARWYEEERKANADLGIRQIDFAMSSDRQLSQEKSEALIALLKDVPKPVLIHCRAGADRTGLASALYIAAIAGEGEEAAEAQLSIRYGHFSVPYLSQAYSMDQSFEAMERPLGLKTL